MDTIPSSKFRKRYASLTTRTEVTVNGHVIGTWVPRAAIREEWREALRADSSLNSRPVQDFLETEERFNTRPFTPVPKSRK